MWLDSVKVGCDWDNSVAYFTSIISSFTQKIRSGVQKIYTCQNGTEYIPRNESIPVALVCASNKIARTKQPWAQLV